MHAVAVLSHWLSTRAVIGHRARLSALLKVVEAALLGGALALTQLGRSRRGAAFEKHHIKAVDRLLGNRHLHREHERVYAALALQVLGHMKRPVLVVDWSDFGPGRTSPRWGGIAARGRMERLCPQPFSPFLASTAPQHLRARLSERARSAPAKIAERSGVCSRPRCRLHVFSTRARRITGTAAPRGAAQRSHPASVPRRRPAAHGLLGALAANVFACAAPVDKAVQHPCARLVAPFPPASPELCPRPQIPN
jgi:hypothetical protein